MKDLLTLNDQPGEHAPSYYAATANPSPDAPPLKGEHRTDVCIIGGGFTGLTAALHLAEKGLSVRVLEAQRLGWGASGRNGGQVCVGNRQEQEWLEAKLGLDWARALWDLAREGDARLRKTIADHGIACDLKSGAIHGDSVKANVAHSYAHAEHMEKVYGHRLEKLDQAAIRDRVGTEFYHGGLQDDSAGHLHPLNYALGLAAAVIGAGAVLHEQSRVTKVTQGAPHRIATETGAVLADHVIYACNGYLGDLERQTAAHVMPINNFIAVTEPLGEDVARSLIRDDVCVADDKFVVNYYRLTADHRMLFGGGESYGYRFPSDIAGMVQGNMLKVYPQLKDVRIEYAWGGTLGITINRMPFVRTLSPTILTGSGYSGQGVAMSALVGRLLAERVAGQTDRFDQLAGLKHRAFPGGGRLRHPLLVLAMSWYALRDRLGF
ncbi:NAD(P)/FAD-dependent oxidoreductase [Halovulum sp. GXIMD14793]